MLFRLLPILLFGFVFHSTNFTGTTNHFPLTENFVETSKVEDVYHSLTTNSFSLPTKESFTQALEALTRAQISLLQTLARFARVQRISVTISKMRFKMQTAGSIKRKIRPSALWTSLNINTET